MPELLTIAKLLAADVPLAASVPFLSPASEYFIFAWFGFAVIIEEYCSTLQKNNLTLIFEVESLLVRRFGLYRTNTMAFHSQG